MDPKILVIQKPLSNNIMCGLLAGDRTPKHPIANQTLKERIADRSSP